MSDTKKITPPADMKTAGNAYTGFNPTVRMFPPQSAATDNRTTTGGNEITVLDRHHNRKTELEDLVGGVDINPYISQDLDDSSRLYSDLDAVGTKYAVLTEFAEGGTAKVSIARDKNLRRLVAIKSLKKDVENLQEQLDAFVTEAKVTAQLDHPGIIPIYGLFRDDEGGTHLVMKLVDGKTLREYLRNLTMNFRVRGINAFDEWILLRKRLEIFVRVCDTIAYAHHRNVIHRDLKPENIMIGKFMEVYVMDWGLSKVISKDDPPPSPDSKISGTPRYFPPEVLRGEPLDLRSDIFTLGLILQEVVTLQYAVTGNDANEFVDHILKGELEPIVHKFNRKIDKTIQAIIRKATAYDVEDRYQTVDELAEDLRRYMGGHSTSARPDTLLEKITRLIFHHHHR